jgi:hypothetical protein
MLEIDYKLTLIFLIILMTQKDVALYYNVKVYIKGFPIKMTSFEVFFKSPLSNENTSDIVFKLFLGIKYSLNSSQFVFQMFSQYIKNIFVKVHSKLSTST